MTLLFDSTVLIEHLRGTSEATELIRAAVDNDSAAASVLSRVEIEGGMRSDERTQVARLFAGLRMEPVTDVIASRAGKMLRRYRRSHGATGVVDYVIAATAEELGSRVVTLNVRHFPMFDGLQPAF